MRDIPTPISDLVEHLMSLGLSPEKVVEAARLMERGTTTRRVTLEQRREKWRLKKQRQRDRKAGVSPQMSPENVPGGDIYLSNTKDSHKELEKKDKSPVLMSPRDDWPTDYVEQFWQAYPPQRRTEKAKVAKKLALIRKPGKVTWARLMAGLERYARSGDVARGYAKGPMVWLNGGCWDDEVRDAPAAGKPAKQPNLLTRIALGIDGEDNDEADRHDGATLDL